MTPLIAVDVDGVLNREGSLEEGWYETPVRLGNATYVIRYNPEHGAKLTALAEETRAQLVWCTTWEQDANTHIGPLIGLPAALPVVPLRAPKLSAGPGWTKTASLVTYAGDRPWVWFDDDAKTWDVVHECGGDCWDTRLLVQVNPLTGLQDKHLQLAREFLSGL